MTRVKYPYFRREVLVAITALADPELQQRIWIDHILPHEGYEHNFDEVVHALFDDADVCRQPSAWVGIVIYQDEADHFETLGKQLWPMIEDLGDVDDQAYMSDPRWLMVIRLAQATLLVMRANDETYPPVFD